MNEHKLHYIPICNKKGSNSVRLRHLKYVNSINYSAADLKTRRMLGRSNLSFKKEYFSLKAAEKVEFSEFQSNRSPWYYHLNRLAKNLKKVSFLQIYGSHLLNSIDSKAKSALLSSAKNLKSLGFSYEIQDPNFSDYERFYDTVLNLNQDGSQKMNQKPNSDDICARLQQSKVVLPKDIVFVIDFRVSNEVLDYPPINRHTHDSEHYLWNLAASYFTLSNVEQPYAHKFESLWNIRKVFLSCDSSNKSFDCFINFLNKLTNIDTLHVQLKKAIQNNQVIYFKNLVSAFEPNMKWSSNLKKLIIDCEDIVFDPIEFADIHFPQELTDLQLNIRNTQIESLENIHYIEQFPEKLKPLSKLKALKLCLPTTCLVNQMIHNMPETLQDMEVLQFDFHETSKEAVYEEIYLNSLLECISTMPKLQQIYLRTDKLNYTYCAYLSHQATPNNIKNLQWIDESLYCNSRLQTQVQTKQWIECKKFEDLNIILNILSESLEYLEIPFVFDGLESEFVVLRFLELLSALKNLKNLNLSLGFKTLDESSVESVNNFVSEIKSTFDDVKDFNLNLNVYYRKIRGNYNMDHLNSLNLSNTKIQYHVQYIHDIHY